MDPFRERFGSNSLRKNRYTIPKRCRACRTTRTRWEFLVQPGERIVHHVHTRYRDTKRNRQVPFRHLQSSTISEFLLDRHIPIQLLWVGDTSWLPSRSAFTIRHGIIPAYMRRCVVRAFFDIAFAFPRLGSHHGRPLLLSHFGGLHIERVADCDGVVGMGCITQNSDSCTSIRN